MAPAAYPENAVLVVDDDPEILRSFTMALRMNNIENVTACEDGSRVLPLLREKAFQVCLLDLMMPGITGEDLLRGIRRECPDIIIIVVTGVNEVDTAVRCMKEGAFDYMVKPVEKNRLVSGVRRAFEIHELQSENRLLKERMLSGTLSDPEAFSGIVTQNRVMHSIFQYAEAIAPSRQPILVTGETGVGKELMIQAIYNLGGSDKPLVSANVAGIDEHVFSDTLFGHVKGAFTGADQKRPGLVEKAGGGILHLDEIGDLNHEAQVKLLRLLEESEYFPLGSDTPRVANVRVVVSTNRDIETLKGSERFRKDLFYRLRTHHIHIPPLRERADDIPLLLDHFIEEAGRSMNREPLPGRTPEVVQLLANCSFPGNVRELKSAVHDAVSRCTGDRLTLSDFQNVAGRAGSVVPQNPVRPAAGGDGAISDGLPDESVIPTIEEATARLIDRALERAGNNKSLAARMLGISRQRLLRHLKKETTP